MTHLGNKDPAFYGRQLLRDMGKENEAYIDEEEVLDFLGYDIEDVYMQKMLYKLNPKKGEDPRVILLDNSYPEACLLPTENKVLVDKYLSKERRRMTLFHEAGHIILPWHRHSLISTNKADMSSELHKKIEKEAFAAGVEIMYPLRHLRKDMECLPVTFESIKIIAHKYRGSFEATCMRYAKVHPERVAIMMTHKKSYEDTFSIEVNYCSTSNSFKHYIKPCTPIHEAKLQKCYHEQESAFGTIKASAWGSSRNTSYDVEYCYHNSRVYVLLQARDSQTYFLK